MNINFSSGSNIIRKIAALLLAVVFMLLIGCKSNNKVSSKDTSSKQTSSMDSSSKDDTSNDIPSEDSISSQESLKEPSQDNTFVNDSFKEDEKEANVSESESLTSLETNNKEEKINLNGTYTLTNDVHINRDDYGEPLYKGNCANLSNPIKGYADVEADELRNKILNAKNTEELYEIKGTKYYVSPGGDDNNDGKSKDTPIRTIAGVTALPLQEGDAVLFERGSVFRTVNTVSLKSGVTYGSYGKGEKPKIYASPKSLAVPSLWTPTKTKNIWKTDFAYKEVGSIVFNHGETIGYRKNKLKEINKEYDFYHDEENGVLYIYLGSENPGKQFKSIEACPKVIIFNLPNNGRNVVVDNLCMKYSSWGAINTYIVYNMHITNCEIGYMGGCQYDARVRMGNAIGNWGGGDGWYVENNWIYQTFDTAISPQGQVNDESQYDNMYIRNNLLEYNNADFEYWCDTPHTLKNFVFDNNICRFTSMGWGTRANDGGYRGIEGVLVMTSKDVDADNISFKNNIIDCPAREIIRWDYNLGFEKALSMSGNKLFVKQKYRTTDKVLRNQLQKDYYANNLNEYNAAFSLFSGFGNIKWFE